MQQLPSPSRRPLLRMSWERLPLRERIWRVGVPLALAAITFGLARWLTPSPSLHGTHQQLGLPPCSFILLTGRPCPSCGATTSFALMARGNWSRAFQANLLAPFGFIALMGWGLCGLMGLVSGRWLRVDMAPWLQNMLIGGAFVIVLVYGAIRFLLW